MWILRRGTVFLVLVLTATAAHATSGSASGSIDAGSNGADATASITGAWGGVFVCRSGTCNTTGLPCDDFGDCDAGSGDTACVPLGNGMVVQNPDPPNEYFTFFFDVLPPGPSGETQASTDFTFNVDLTLSNFVASFKTSGESTQTGGGSSGNSVTFFIPRPPTPTGLAGLGERSVIALAVGLLLAGVYFIARRLA